jgi:hypothetical protein
VWWSNAFAVTGVPEPEEWLLLALVVGMLGWMMYRKMSVAQTYVTAGK